jgi:small subunit ribosomal protein S1
MYNNLKPGMKLFGVVTGMTDYAAFVDVGGGVKAVLKVEEISSTRIYKVEEKLRIGQRISDIVKKYDKDTGRIDISIKDLMGSFESNVNNLKEGDLVDGIVRGRTKTGIFVELKGDLTAMADHISGVEYGQKVLVHIKRINNEKERIRVEIIG